MIVFFMTVNKIKFDILKISNRHYITDSLYQYLPKELMLSRIDDLKINNKHYSVVFFFRRIIEVRTEIGKMLDSIPLLASSSYHLAYKGKLLRTDLRLITDKGLAVHPSHPPVATHNMMSGGKSTRQVLILEVHT